MTMRAVGENGTDSAEEDAERQMTAMDGEAAEVQTTGGADGQRTATAVADAEEKTTAADADSRTNVTVAEGAGMKENARRAAGAEPSRTVTAKEIGTARKTETAADAVNGMEIVPSEPGM